MPVSRETLDRLKLYHALLLQWQKRINLISPTTVSDAWERHVLDSVQICSLIKEADHVIDIGSGGGFPGLVQAILMAEQGVGRIDLVESNGKKCAFMNAVVRETGIKSTGVEVFVHNERIEVALPTLPCPMVVTARALASLNDLFTLTHDFLGADAYGLFPKGRQHKDEVAEAEKNWSFDMEDHVSQFSDDSVILKISNLKAL